MTQSTLQDDIATDISSLKAYLDAGGSLKNAMEMCRKKIGTISNDRYLTLQKFIEEFDKNNTVKNE